MAALPGHIKNETVVIGCHRDGEYDDSFAPTQPCLCVT